MYTDINILLSLIQIYVEILHTSMLNKNPFPYTQVTIMCLCFAVNLFQSIYFIKNKFWGYRKIITFFDITFRISFKLQITKNYANKLADTAQTI